MAGEMAVADLSKKKYKVNFLLLFTFREIFSNKAPLIIKHNGSEYELTNIED